MELLHMASVVFALVTATVAGAYAVLAWRLFRASPVGTVMLLLAVAMFGSVCYHSSQLVLGEGPVSALIEAGLNTVLFALVLVAVRTDTKLRQLAEGEPRR
ncbi:hypothetical protein [Natronomonas sp. EA1]|uniref:hypothetical protein n=1 Tax=Natronomonas sp. EA1 TaxID=3421655 RepID=UPI003EBF3989